MINLMEKNLQERAYSEKKQKDHSAKLLLSLQVCQQPPSFFDFMTQAARGRWLHILAQIHASVLQSGKAVSGVSDIAEVRVLPELFQSFGVLLSPSYHGPFLSQSQGDVLLKLLSGKSLSAIASEKGRDIRTIGTQKHEAMEKAGLQDNRALYLAGAMLSYSTHVTAMSSLTHAEQRMLSSYHLTGSITKTAQFLGKDPRTVSTQKRAIMAKLNVANDVQLFQRTLSWASLIAYLESIKMGKQERGIAS